MQDCWLDVQLQTVVDKTPTECARDSAYFKQSSVLALVEQHTPDQQTIESTSTNRQAAASKGLFGWTTHQVQEDETS